MAEPQGISRTFQDIARGLMGAYQGVQGFRGEVGRNLGNVGRFFTSQAPVTPPASAAMRAAADRQMAEVARLGGQAGLQTAMTRGIREANKMQSGKKTPAPTGQIGGTSAGRAAANPIRDLFAPMFDSLRQQEQQANQRYEANRQQVTNIYGQITGARSQDIPAMETAFKRLIDAASTRSAAVNTSIDTSEAARLQQNQAALQSMGLEGLSTSQGDIASQTAAEAQNINLLNSANWENMLRTMGATAGETARSDIAGFNYAMAEDLGQLRGAREDFAQDLGEQRFDLRSQKAKATFEYQQAQQRAAAAAAAAQQRAKAAGASAAEKQMADALKASGPVTQGVATRVANGLLSPGEAAKVTNTINEWFTNVAPPTGRWNPGAAKNSILSLAGTNLTPSEQSAIVAIFDNMKW